MSGSPTPPLIQDANASPPDKFDLALDASKRLLDNQFSAIDTIQTKVGVLLGFAVTTLGIIFSLGYTWVTGHRILASASAVLLLTAIVIFAISMSVTTYTDVPEPQWLWALLNSPKADGTLVQKKLIANYTGAFDDNRKERAHLFKSINWGIGFLIAGIAVFAFGVLIT
jgi:vacuolar-type H+-ATPase subunit I/STV1